MRLSGFPRLAIVTTLLSVGCADAADELSENEVLSEQAQELTLAECAAQRDACFSKNPLFGIFTCPGQYRQCVATASTGLPAEVAAAIRDAAVCAREGAACLAAAETPSAALICTENEAQCVATIVGVELPDVVEGTAECVQQGVACIEGSKKVSDLRVCGEQLTGCALEQVVEVIPPQVVEVVTEVNSCRTELNACIAAQESASGVAACTEESAACVAESLDVPLPEVPLSEVVGCAETAASCALRAATVRDVAACATGLTSCAADVVGDVDLPDLSCEQKWTACMAKNPFDFLRCGAELLSCGGGGQ